MKFRNPIIPAFYPDPSICRVGDFYLAASTFEYFPGVPADIKWFEYHEAAGRGPCRFSNVHRSGPPQSVSA